MIPCRQVTRQIVRSCVDRAGIPFKNNDRVTGDVLRSNRRRAPGECRHSTSTHCYIYQSECQNPLCCCCQMQISRILRASWKSYKFFYCVPPTATLNRDIFVKENFVVSSFAREIMPDSCTESIDVRDVDGRRKKQRFSTSKIWQSTSTPNQRTLELEGVIEVLKEYDSCEGNDINCSICGEYTHFSPPSLSLVWPVERIQTTRVGC